MRFGKGLGGRKAKKSKKQIEKDLEIARIEAARAFSEAAALITVPAPSATRDKDRDDRDRRDRERSDREKSDRDRYRFINYSCLQRSLRERCFTLICFRFS
jgi:hypothetical protein